MISLLSPLRYGLIGVIASFGLLAGQQAFAANASVTIEQESSLHLLGQWVLTLPDGSRITNGEKTKTLTNLDAGTYWIAVRAPSGASSKIVLKESSVILEKASASVMAFEIEDGKAFTLSIEYIYRGTVIVDSNPRGISFELRGPDNTRFSGTTPANFDNMAPYQYRVSYSNLTGCEAHKAQERELPANGLLTFFANVTCGDKPISMPGKTAREMATEPSLGLNPHKPALSIVQTSNQTEVLPGGMVRFTLIVRNLTTKTLKNLRVTDQFNPESIRFVPPLPAGGVVKSNLLVWNISELRPGQIWSVSFDGTVSHSLKAGQRIVLMARIDGEGLDIYDPSTLSSVNSVGIAVLPQTGGKFDLLLALLSAFGALLLTTFTIRRKQHVALTA